MIYTSAFKTVAANVKDSQENINSLVDDYANDNDLVLHDLVMKLDELNLDMANALSDIEEYRNA
jgi:hypothetical protein